MSHDIIISKLLERVTWNFETRFNIPCVSCVTFHLSHVTCYMSHDIIISKLLELVTWHVQPMFTIPWVLRVTCHISFVMCHVSGVTCHTKKWENWRGLSVEGLLSTWHNPPSITKKIIVFGNLLLGCWILWTVYCDNWGLREAILGEKLLLFRTW